MASVINGAWTALLEHDGFLRIHPPRMDDKPIAYQLAYAGKFPPGAEHDYGRAIDFMDRQLTHSRLWLWGYDRMLDVQAWWKRLCRLPQACAAAREAFGDAWAGRARAGSVYDDSIPF